VERLKERLAIARRALSTLQELVRLEHPSPVERDAAIQRFEYTCEAVWKAAQRYLLEVEGISAGNEAVAEDIYSHLPQYAGLLAVWLTAMEERAKLTADG